MLSGKQKPEWSGIARGCSHPHANPQRDYLHTVERQAEQLQMAGIGQVSLPTMDWLAGDIKALGVPETFGLIVPGGALHRPDKRWPTRHFVDLAGRMTAAGVAPVLLGTQSESAVIDEIARAEPKAVNLLGRTGFGEIAELARRARYAVGNDTGPMHLIAAIGCPTLALFGAASDPALCAQRGPRVRVLRETKISTLSPDSVWSSLIEEGWQAPV